MPLDDVRIEVLGLHLATLNLDTLLTCSTLDELRDRLGLDYFEVQLHLDLGVDHIKRIEVAPGIVLSEQAQQWASRNNISIQTMR